MGGFAKALGTGGTELGISLRGHAEKCGHGATLRVSSQAPCRRLSRFWFQPRKPSQGGLECAPACRGSTRLASAGSFTKSRQNWLGLFVPQRRERSTPAQ